MARYQIRYTSFTVAAPKPIGDPLSTVPTVTAYRPVVPIRLDFDGKVWAAYSIVDSGADQCLFPSFIVAMLSLKVQNARVSKFHGAGSVNQVSLFFDNIGLTVGNLPRFVTTLAFSAAMNQSGFGLLGQQGFFNRFKVDFDLLRRFFYIEDSIARPTDPLAFPPPSARH